LAGQRFQVGAVTLLVPFRDRVTADCAGSLALGEIPLAELSALQGTAIEAEVSTSVTEKVRTVALFEMSWFVHIVAAVWAALGLTTLAGFTRCSIAHPVTACEFDFTLRRAAILCDEISVVTLFSCLLDTIAALGIAPFQVAIQAAAVSIDVVSIVAFFVWIELPIATEGTAVDSAT
jgi:hypothetical protein